MSGTFASLNTALGALRYNRVAMDVASGNIANVDTDGYTRRRVEAAAVGAPAQPAMWSRWEGAGDGVRVAGLTRMADAVLDARVRAEHGRQGYLDVRQTVLEQLEQGVGEPGDNGVAAALAQFRASWHDLANNPSSDAARGQVLARGASLADAVNAQVRNVAAATDAQRVRVLAGVDEVNSAASALADVNKAIVAGQANGADVNTMLDTRDQLTLRLTELTGGRATVNADGSAAFDLASGGATGPALVQGPTAGRLLLASGVTPTGGADGLPITFAVTGPSGTQPAGSGLLGELGGLAELVDVTLPAYRSGLGAVAQQLVDDVNALHRSGYDETGTPGGPFFAWDPADPSAPLRVVETDPARVAFSQQPAGGLDSRNADALGTAAGVETAYQQLVNGLGSAVLGARRAAANQEALTHQFDGAREQLAGVNLDEEVVTMMQAQRAYEAAARVMTTVDSVLDTLINRTGLVR